MPHFVTVSICVIWYYSLIVWWWPATLPSTGKLPHHHNWLMMCQHSMFHTRAPASLCPVMDISKRSMVFAPVPAVCGTQYRLYWLRSVALFYHSIAQPACKMTIHHLRTSFVLALLLLNICCVTFLCRMCVAGVRGRVSRRGCANIQHTGLTNDECVQVVVAD